MSDRDPRRALHVARTIPATPLAPSHHDRWKPPTDVYETDTQIIVKVDIAGIEDGNMTITIEDGVLRVQGFRTDCSAFSKLAVHRMEIMCGEFETNVHLPHAIDRNADLHAAYDHGMLTIVLPKEVAHKVHITQE